MPKPSDYELEVLKDAYLTARRGLAKAQARLQRAMANCTDADDAVRRLGLDVAAAEQAWGAALLAAELGEADA